MLTKFFTHLLDTLIYLFLQGPLSLLCSGSTILTRALSGCYHGTFMLRRWLKAEPRWQEHDAVLGIPDPAKLIELGVLYRAWVSHLVACDQCWDVQHGCDFPKNKLCAAGRDLYRAYMAVGDAMSCGPNARSHDIQS